MKNHLKSMILTALLMILPYPVNAACTLADISGTWRAFIVTGSTSFQGFARATLIFSETGKLDAANSTFANSITPAIKFAKGSIKADASCRVTAKLLTKAGVTLSIVDGQMNASKDVIAGVYRTSSKDAGLINLIR